MNEILDLINQIPVRHNWTSMIILCGWVQGLFLGLIIIIRSIQENKTLLYFGIYLTILSFILCDGYLCYTGLMKYVLHFNDSTEVFVLLIGPMIYFLVKSILNKSAIELSKHWFHFVIPLLYVASQILYYVAPIEVKYNAYIGAYFPNSEFIDYNYDQLGFTIKIKDEFRWWILFSLITYLFLSLKIIIRNKSKFSNSFWKIRFDKYSFSTALTVLFIAMFLFIFLIFLNFETDDGDHFISIFLSLTIYSFSFFILAQSKFFDKTWVADKYDTSGLQTHHSEIFQQIKTYFLKEKYFLQSDASLQDLSEKLNQPANYISQSINKEAQQNFNEFINSYRVEEVKNRLGNEDYANLNIAGIGQSVGFKSKSAFYTAFKKQTKMTPTQFLEFHKK